MQFDVVTFVSTARGAPALRQVLAQLPSTFGAPVVCLVQATTRTLEEVRAATRLRVQWAEPGVPLEKGTVYLSPPHCALVWRPDRTLTVSPVSIESTSLNPVDMFLASTACVHGAGAACFILAGNEGDGVKGAVLVKEMGGTVLVLDRATARHWELAEPVVRAGGCTRVITLAEAADALRACPHGSDLIECAEIQIELGFLLDGALALAGTHMGHISRRMSHGDALQVVVHRGLSVNFLERFDPVPVADDTATGRAFKRRARVVVEDVMQAPDYARRQDALLCGFRAAHATPIPASEGRPVHGVLTALFVAPHVVSRYEEREMDAAADGAARLVAGIR